MKSVLTALLFCGFLMNAALADTYKLSDGQTVSGDAVSVDERGAVFRAEDGKYSERIPWTKFSQEDLKAIGAKNSKAAALIEPFIEITEQEKEQKRAIVIHEVPRLERATDTSLFGALSRSGLGMALLGLLFAANIYAAYEISIYRALHPALVCGVSAVLPLIGPIGFLCIPTQIKKEEASWDTGAEQATATFAMPGAEAAEADVPPTAKAATSGLPRTQSFARGTFTFNRRFFETKFPNFFGIVRRDADKNMVLAVRTGRGTFVAERITRITASDVHLHVQEGAASREIAVQYQEIQEVQLKHKHA